MQNWQFEELKLKGAYKITPFFAEDNRGGFLKDYQTELFAQNGINFELKEVFYTLSRRGVLRGLHFQEPHQQAKLVRCVSGKVYDVLVDLRPNSPTFKQWQGFVLSAENMTELLVPEGFAHGYLVLEDSIVSYKCNEKFYGADDTGICYNDATLGVNWDFSQIGGVQNLILSDKDKNLPTFAEWQSKHSQN